MARLAGEFRVCKNMFVALNTGWHSDRSAIHLASGKPVVMQDTEFSSQHLCGEGLFAVTSLEEAVAAINTVRADDATHSRAAREIAREYLATDRVPPAFLNAIGM